MTIDINRIRQETPGCFSTIHLHNSGSSLMPLSVVDAIRSHLELEMIRGGYEAEEHASERLRSTYESIATMLNCSASEIALTESATASWNAVFFGIAQKFMPGDRILTCRSEYVSNMIAYLQICRRTGAQVQVVPDDKNGQLDVKALEAMIDPKVKLISITHVPTHNGLVTPICEIGQIASDYEIPYLVDACQSVGQMPLDVVQIGCDALSATGRKYLRGPRGTGFLYVREDSMEKFPPSRLDLHAANWVQADDYEVVPGAKRYEMFESSIANRIGLGAAVDYALGLGLNEIYSRIRFLADRLREGLVEIEGVTVRDKGVEKCGIVTFTIDGVNPQKFQKDMRKFNINVGLSTRNCALLDLGQWGVESLIRSPVHYFNTEQEIDLFLSQIRIAAKN